MSDPLRRRLVTALGASAFLTGPRLSHAASGVSSRSLRFENLHTGEKLAVEYFAAGRYVSEALTSVDHLLRDFRTGEVAVIDVALLDLMHRISVLTASSRAFQVISGYRSPSTNQALHRRSTGVADASLHMRGQAIDIRLPDTPLAMLREAALSVRVGGVGYYPASGFVHVDTGRVRAW
jgi:uncharacterized protein YcbK (DUF882 family)